MATISVGTGFLYGNGTGDDMAGQTPICCTPEYLSAFGIGLDSTLGDGKVQGVMREDQAEQQFHAMYKDQYTGAEELQAISGKLKEYLKGVTGDGNIKNMFDNPDAELQAILTEIENVITGNPAMEKMLTTFFGEETVNGAGGGAKGLATIMARTVISSYDVRQNDGDENVNAENDDVDAFTVGEKDRADIDKHGAVSLGEIFQWALETNVFMDVYNKAKNDGENFIDFSNRAFTAMSEGNEEEFNAIAQKAGLEPEQLQVVLSSMMNNHANIMASPTGGIKGSGKNGAHQFLNNINNVYGGDDRAFQFIHLGNIGGSNVAGTADLNATRDTIKAGGDSKAIFNAGDNGNNTNGGMIDIANNTAVAESFANDDVDYTQEAEAPPEAALTDDLKSEVLSELNTLDAGSVDLNAPVTVGGYKVSITDSEDFENEGYDVVVVTITDPTTGMIVGSFTATEDGSTKKLVEYADNNGDGLVDKVGDDGLSVEEFDNTGFSSFTYNAETGQAELPETGDFLAKNEDEEGNNL